MEFNGRTTNFTDELKGSTYATVKPLLERGSKILALSGNSPISMANKSALAIRGTSAAALVGEGQRKPAGRVSFTEQPINFAKFVIQQRFTEEEVELTEAGMTEIFDKTILENADVLARAIDVTVLHGTDPLTGTLVMGGPGITVYSWLTKDAQVAATTSDEPEDLKAAIWDSIGAVNKGRSGRVNGILLSNDAYFDLAGAERSSGAPLVPGFVSATGEGSNFRGIPATVSNSVAYDFDSDADYASGNETGIYAITGDFSRVKLGVEFLNYTVKTSGNPDGQYDEEGRALDLGETDEILVRQELRVSWYNERPEAFALVRDVEEVPAGE